MRRRNTGRSDKDKVRMIASKIDGARERSKGRNADQRANINRSESTEGTKRAKERLRNSLK